MPWNQSVPKSCQVYLLGRPRRCPLLPSPKTRAQGQLPASSPHLLQQPHLGLSVPVCMLRPGGPCTSPPTYNHQQLLIHPKTKLSLGKCPLQTLQLHFSPCGRCSTGVKGIVWYLAAGLQIAPLSFVKCVTWVRLPPAEVIAPIE